MSRRPTLTASSSRGRPSAAGRRTAGTSRLAGGHVQGDQLLFYVKALAWAPRAIKRYPREIINTLAEITFGAGGLTLIAGTVGVIAFLAFFAGTEVGIQGYASLSQIGVAKFSAFISAYFNTREVAPLVSSIALAATVGCGYTARLGAMRISEEIDALEVMGVPSLPFLVTTRMIAAFIAVIPLYVVALCASYLSPRLIVTLIYGQSPGTYDHYFLQFLPPIDMLWSFGKLLFLSVCDHPDPLLLRLHRLRRPGRRRHGGGPGDPDQHRHGRRGRLLPQLRDLGLDHHGADHGVAGGRCWSTSTTTASGSTPGCWWPASSSSPSSRC